MYSPQRNEQHNPVPTSGAPGPGPGTQMTIRVPSEHGEPPPQYADSAILPSIPVTRVMSPTLTMFGEGQGWLAFARAAARLSETQFCAQPAAVSAIRLAWVRRCSRASLSAVFVSRRSSQSTPEDVTRKNGKNGAKPKHNNLQFGNLGQLQFLEFQPQ